MMSLTFGLFTQVSGSGPLGPLVHKISLKVTKMLAQKLVVRVVLMSTGGQHHSLTFDSGFS